jgi:hypothetical protein
MQNPRQAVLSPLLMIGPQGLATPVAGGRAGQTIGLNVVLTPDVGDREIERSGQFPLKQQ